jgi:hypothetical protein
MPTTIAGPGETRALLKISANSFTQRLRGKAASPDAIAIKAYLSLFSCNSHFPKREEKKILFSVFPTR